jgi:hypothetical protein
MNQSSVSAQNPKMRFYTLLFPLAVFVGLATANDPPYGPWNITNYIQRRSSVAPSGYTYSFNITYAPVPGYSKPGDSQPHTEPAFTTFCKGNDTQGTLNPCDDPAVSATTIPAPGHATLVVMHVYSVPDSPETRAVEYFLAGNTTVKRPFLLVPQTLQIIATQETVEA